MMTSDSGLLFWAILYIKQVYHFLQRTVSQKTPSSLLYFE